MPGALEPPDKTEEEVLINNQIKENLKKANTVEMFNNKITHLKDLLIERFIEFERAEEFDFPLEQELFEKVIGKMTVAIAVNEIRLNYINEIVSELKRQKFKEEQNESPYNPC